MIVSADGLDFEALLLRVHPAASRVQLLAAETPASFVAWDVLALGDEDLRDEPLAERRERLEQAPAARRRGPPGGASGPSADGRPRRPRRLVSARRGPGA